MQPPGPPATRIRGALIRGIEGGILLALAMPLIVTPHTVAPFVVGKALYVRVIIEILTAAYLALVTLDPSYRPRPSWVVLALGICTAASLLAGATGVAASVSFWSDYQRMAGGWDALHWLALVVVMAAVLRTPRQWGTVLLVYVVIAGVLALAALAQVYLGLDSAYVAGGPRVGASTGNPTYLAALLMVGAILLTGGAAQRLAEQHAGGAAGARLALVALGAVGTFALVRALLLTGSRGPLLGLLCGACVPVIGSLLLPRSPRRRYALAWSAGLIVLTLTLFGWDLATAGRPGAAWDATTTAQRAFGPASAQRGISVRLELWRIGLDGFRHRPAFGWGPENYPRIFDRHAGPAVQALTWLPADSPHNQPIEVLATTGVAGGLAYALVWGVLGFVLLARVADADRLQAFTALGALLALFVHGLTFFDTPGTLLGFSILAAWTAAREVALSRFPPGTPGPRTGSHWLPAAAATLGAAAIVLATATVHLPMYRAASGARQALNPTLPAEQRTGLAAESFKAFPPMSPYLRRLVFGQLALELHRLTPAEQQEVIAFATERAIESLEADPGDARLLMVVLPVLQAIAQSEGDLDRLEPYVRQLTQLAPARPQTQVILATQALRRRNYDEALRIVDRFQASVPVPVPALVLIREQIRAEQVR